MSRKVSTRFGTEDYSTKSKINFQLISTVIRSYLLHRTFRVKYGEVITQLKGINSGVPQGSVLKPVLYSLYIANLPVAGLHNSNLCGRHSHNAVHNNHIEASSSLQESFYHIQRWFKKWRLKANGTKSVQVTFTIRRETCLPVTMNGHRIPQADDIKYLGLYQDRRLDWKKQIYTKRKQLGLQLGKMYWLGKKSQLSTENKLLLYNVILKPIWMVFNSMVFNSISDSNIEVLQRFQNKILNKNYRWCILVCYQRHYIKN